MPTFNVRVLTCKWNETLRYLITTILWADFCYYARSFGLMWSLKSIQYFALICLLIDFCLLQSLFKYHDQHIGNLISKLGLTRIWIIVLMPKLA